MNDNLLPFSEEFLLSAYRDRTLSMLRRYARAAVELGRLPSLLGREFFRAKVTSYTVHTFEDAIIFAFDMERSLERLTPLERTVLGRIVLQEYTQQEVARKLRICQSTVQRQLNDAVDHLTEVLLDNGLLNPTILQPRYQRRAVTPLASLPVASSEPGVEAETQPKRLAPIVEIKACQEHKNADFVATA